MTILASINLHTAPESFKLASLLTAGIQQVDKVHPLGSFEWEQVGVQTIACSVVLFLAGLLCSAGGIGGGGVYVTVLMVAGALSPHDAVPLSKAVVFFGSLSSLVLNLRRELGGTQAGARKPCIDYNICSLVVPSSLIGTLVGVLLNHTAEDFAILFMLSSVLVGMTCMIGWTTWCQYYEEKLLHYPAGSREDGHHRAEAAAAAAESVPLVGKGPAESAHRARAPIGVCMLLVVILCGVMRHHAGSCLMHIREGGDGQAQDACSHPVPRLFVGNRLEALMSDQRGAAWTLSLTLAIPISVCAAVALYCSHDCIRHANWQPAQVVKYLVMGTLTGCLAGLVGIGGGLIFSPFFLIMGVDPSVAVATSSTCVIFTSSSTTFQYFLTDRIIVSLTVVYGCVNLLASYGGTAFVHFLQDRFSAQKSYITAIVAVGVFLSAALAIREFSVALST